MGLQLHGIYSDVTLRKILSRLFGQDYGSNICNKPSRGQQICERSCHSSHNHLDNNLTRIMIWLQVYFQCEMSANNWLWLYFLIGFIIRQIIHSDKPVIVIHQTIFTPQSWLQEKFLSSVKVRMIARSTCTYALGRMHKNKQLLISKL